MGHAAISTPGDARKLLEGVPDGIGGSTAERMAGAPTIQEPRSGRRASARSGDASAEAEPPRFPGYTILGRIGAGAFGTVYRARDEALQREVAFKVLAGDGAVLGGEARARFLHEARALARVRHPNVLQVYSVIEHEGATAIVTELIEGETLERTIEARGPCGAVEAAHIGIEVCRALAAVHAAGIVHRDVKPSNVLRERGGRIVLADFGLGVFTASAPTPSDGGDIAGTPVFMAPEQIRGDPPDPRTDLYSLGVVLYFLASGSFPADSERLQELLGRIVRGEIRPLRDARPDLPEGFVRSVGRALATDPRARFRSAGDMEAALLSTIDGSDPRTGTARGRRGLELVLGVGRWKLRLAAGLGALVAVAFALWWMLGPPREAGPTLAMVEGPAVRVAAHAGAHPSVAGAVGPEAVGPEAVRADVLRREDRRAIALVPAIRTLGRALRRTAPGTEGMQAGRDPVGSGVDRESVAEAYFALRAAALAPAGLDGREAPVRALTEAVRETPGGRRQVVAGERVRPGERLSLRYAADRETFLYVVAETADGARWLLFPLRGSALENPLPEGIALRVPDGESWMVPAIPGEAVLVVLSTDRPLDALEDAGMSSREPDTYPRLDRAALESLLLRLPAPIQRSSEAVLSGESTLRAALTVDGSRGRLASAPEASVTTIPFEIAH